MSTTTETFAVPLEVVERARDAYSWDVRHVSPRYGGAMGDKFLGYSDPTDAAVVPLVEQIKALTDMLGGLRIGDYVHVPDRLIRGLVRTSPADLHSELNGYSRLRVVRASNECLTGPRLPVVEHYDPDNPRQSAVMDDDRVAVIHPDSFKVTEQVLFVPAGECIYTL